MLLSLLAIALLPQGSGSASEWAAAVKRLEAVVVEKDATIAKLTAELDELRTHNGRRLQNEDGAATKVEVQAGGVIKIENRPIFMSECIR